MRATIRDRAALLALSPVQVMQYLLSSGWKQVDRVPNRYTVWAGGPEQEEEILLPDRQALADYHLRISEVIAQLERLEGRSQLEILADFENSSADIIRIRVGLDGAADGTIPLDTATQVLESAKDMMLAAACAAISPRPYYHARRWAEASEYVGALRAGQTERGSYVVTIVSPVPPELDVPPGELFETEEPFPRRATVMLSTALEAVADAAVSFELTAFEKQVSKGVSANLCQALAGLGSSAGRFNDVAVGLSWSRTRPPHEALRSTFLLPGDRLPILQEAGRVLKSRAPLEECEVQGLVVKLDRKPRAQFGTATVLGAVEGSVRSIRVVLARREYDLMIQAHKRREPISVVGELIKRGNQFMLENPRELRMVVVE